MCPYSTLKKISVEMSVISTNFFVFELVNNTQYMFSNHRRKMSIRVHNVNITREMSIAVSPIKH